MLHRISILSLALLAFTSAAPAVGPVPERTGFRVYTRQTRCSDRILVGVYPTIGEAARAAGVRRDAFQVHEITFGIGGGIPLHTVYTQTCSKVGWEKRIVTCDLAKAQAFIKEHGNDPSNRPLLVHDYTNKEVFRIHGYQRTGCRRARLALGDYSTASEVFEALERFRADEGLTRCTITMLTRDDTSAGFGVYVRGCKGWRLHVRKADAATAHAVAATLHKDETRVEVVRHVTVD